MTDLSRLKKQVTQTLNNPDAGAIDETLAGFQQPKQPGNTSAEAHSPITATSSSVSDPANLLDPKVIKANDPYAAARPASKIDLAGLNESNIMDLPFIKAKSFDIAAMLQVKAKDPAIRFRWVNFKNYEGGNYAMFKSIGFENSVIEDVDTDVTPIGDHLVKDGTTIKFYDVILMKVNVLLLMSAYKANIQKSLDRVGKWSEAALAEAKKTFRNDVSPDIISEMKQRGYNIEFFQPTKQEMQDQDKTFAV